MIKSINPYSTYILSDRKRNTFYIGVTDNLERRVLQHKTGVGSIFTKKYQIKVLLHFEIFPTMFQAIRREKQLKKWRREWKINLIKDTNPTLEDLAKDWFTEEMIDNYRQGTEHVED